MTKSLKELILSYLSEVPIISVATSLNNRPWACNVYYAFDHDLNIYFISKTFRRHSKEIRENSHVSATICAPHLEPFDMPGRGIQLEGQAFQVEDISEAEKYLEIYLERLPSSIKLHAAVNDITGEALPRIYKIVPERYVLFDERNFPENPQQELLFT